MKKGKLYIILRIHLCLCLGLALEVGSAQTLDVYIQKAVQNHPSIKQWQTTRDLYQLNIDAAKKEYLPTVEANLRRSYNWGLFIDPATNVLSNFNSQVYSGSLYSEIEIFNGGRIYHTVEQNRLLYMASGYDQKAVEMSVSLDVTKIYFQLYTTKRMIENISFQIKKSKLVLDRTEKLLYIGTLSKKDELNVKSDVTAKELKLLKAQNNYRLLLTQLYNLTGVKDSLINFSDIPQIPITQWNLTPIIKDSLSPTLRSLHLQIEAMQHAQKVAKSAYYPVLTVGAGLTTRSSNLIQSELSSQFSNNLSKIAFFNLKVPIFSKNLNQLNVNKQILGAQLLQRKKDLLSFTYKNTESEERTELQNMQSEYIKSSEQLELMQQQVSLAEKAYEAGTITFYEYQITRNNFIDLQNSLTLLVCEFYYKKMLWEKYL